jgi:hypothetical protein
MDATIPSTVLWLPVKKKIGIEIQEESTLRRT